MADATFGEIPGRTWRSVRGRIGLERMEICDPAGVIVGGMVAAKNTIKTDLSAKQ